MYRKKKSIINNEKTDVSDDKLVDDLNLQQKRAVTCPITQSTLVLSGAGLLFS